MNREPLHARKGGVRNQTGARVRATSVSEKDFMQNVIELARLTGWLTYHTFDSRHSAAGFPDLVLLRRGELIFLELKSETGQLSAEQVAWIGGLEAVAGANPKITVRVAKPSQFDELAELLKRR